MPQDFFVKKDSCSKCPLEIGIKSGKFKRLSEKNELQQKSDLRDVSQVDYLFLTDCVERKEDLEKLYKLIKAKGISKFAISPAIGCRSKYYELPAPLYTTYKYCNSFDITKYNPKVVLTLGKAYNHFTMSSVFDSWREFNEILFNETYFYPHIKYKNWKDRIYPCAFIQDIFEFDSFEHFHFEKQLEFARKYVENYEKEKFVFEPFTIVKVEDIDSWQKEFQNEKYVAIDTETNSLNVFIDDFKVGCIQCSFDGKTGYYLPFENINKRSFSRWLQDKFQIWANGKYDTKALNRVGIKGYHVDEDIIIIYHMLNTERSSNSLKVLSWFVGFGGYEDELDDYKKKYKVSNYLDIPEDILMNYAALDSIVTYRLYEYLHKFLVARQKDTYDLYRDVIIPVIPAIQEMEENGILVDKEYLEEYHNTLVIKKEEVEKEIYKIAGRKFNIGSNDELGLVLKEMGLPSYGETKKGGYKTGEEILNTWANDGFDIAKKILEYRKISKLDNTYVGTSSNEDEEDFFSSRDIEDSSDGLYKYIMSDGRIHGTVMPAMTNSLRSSSFDPNIQNYPKHGEEGQNFRKVFIAPENYIFCEADYSGFQLRIMGLYSGDETMKDAFNNKGGDLHSVTAQGVFCRNLSLEEFLTKKKELPYSDFRYKAKTVNFALIFGMVAFTFKEQLKVDWSEEDVKSYIKENKLDVLVDSKTGFADEYLTVATDIRDKFFTTYSGVAEYIKMRHEEALNQGYIQSPFFPGCRRHLPELLRIGKNLPKERKSYYSGLKNISVNSDVQGFEAITVYKAITKIHKAIKEGGLKSKLVGTVHDSIVLYVHEEEKEIMYHVLKNSMEVYDYDIPIVCEVEYGDIWGFGKEVFFD